MLHVMCNIEHMFSGRFFRFNRVVTKYSGIIVRMTNLKRRIAMLLEFQKVTDGSFDLTVCRMGTEPVLGRLKIFIYGIFKSPE